METKKLTRPIWNKSTATNLLSQNPPPSVIHTGDGPGTPYDLGLEDMQARMSRPESVASHRGMRHVVSHYLSSSQKLNSNTRDPAGAKTPQMPTRNGAVT